MYNSVGPCISWLFLARFEPKYGQHVQHSGPQIPWRFSNTNHPWAPKPWNMKVLIPRNIGEISLPPQKKWWNFVASHTSFYIETHHVMPVFLFPPKQALWSVYIYIHICIYWVHFPVPRMLARHHQEDITCLVGKVPRSNPGESPQKMSFLSGLGMIGNFGHIFTTFRWIWMEASINMYKYSHASILF